MTRRDADDIAQAMHDNRPFGAIRSEADKAICAMHYLCATALADTIGKKVKGFDRDLFLTMCGVINI